MEERRRATDEQIGYLTGKLEEFGKTLEVVAIKLDKLEDKMSEKFTTVETVFKVLKFIGAGLLLVVTFKFGDVAQLWENIFK